MSVPVKGVLLISSIGKWLFIFWFTRNESSGTVVDDLLGKLADREIQQHIFTLNIKGY